MSNETEQNFSFPTTKHKLVYVKLHIMLTSNKACN